MYNIMLKKSGKILFPIHTYVEYDDKVEIF
jgi:hypothetical protein